MDEGLSISPSQWSRFLSKRIDVKAYASFLFDTSASLLVQENADRAVLADLEHWLAKFVGDGDPIFTHRAEGPDDMAAHSSSADSDLSECSLCQSPIDVRYLARDLFVRASVPATYS